MLQLAYVRARAECALACACQDNRARLALTLDSLEHYAQLVQHLARQRIHLLRPVKPDDSYETARFINNEHGKESRES
jgi:hypothetical protein